MIRRDMQLRKLQREYERVSRLDYELPLPLRELEWVLPFKSAAVYNALRGGERALSGLDIRPKLHPTAVYRAAGSDRGAKAEEMTNVWETVLRWNFERAAARRGNTVASMIWNALVYDEVVSNLIHLPTQINVLRNIGVDTHRHEAAMRYGPFALRLLDPKSVHVRYSDYMAEEALETSVMTAQDVVQSYGTQARALQEIIAADPEHAWEKYVVARYLNYEDSVSWYAPGDNEQAVLDGGSELMVARNEWPFLSYMCTAGGTITESAPEYQRKPLLFPVVKAQMWLVANVIGTLLSSQAVAEGNEPVHLFQGVGAENILLDLSEPGGRIDIPSGLVSYQRLQRSDVDPGLRELLNRHEADISRATLPSVLVTAEALPGETFSGYNLRVQTAVGSLLPFKRLVERQIEGIFDHMLLYSYYSGHDLTGYGDGPERWTIPSEMIDPDAIVLHVELAPDVPIDRLQKITAAVALATQLNYSPKRVMEFLGESDPHGALREYIQWQFYLAKMKGRIARIEAEESGKIQQLAAQMAQELLAQQSTPEPGSQEPPLPTDQLRAFAEGADMSGVLRNPEAGGAPPIEAMMELATMEGATGQTRAETRQGAFEALGQ
jgi:hypothetical protein